MSNTITKVRSITLDGTAYLEDGREMQLVVDGRGSLGVAPKTREDHAQAVDQHQPIVYQRPPTMAELGLDQA